MSVGQNLLSYFRRLLVVDAVSRIENYGSDAGERVEELDVLNLSAAWACVNLIAGTVGSLPIMVFKAAPGGHDVPAKEHPLYRILHDSPNAEQTSLDFWEGAAASIELKGNAVARKLRGAKDRLIGLEPMAWDYLGVRRGRDGQLVYEFQGEKLRADDVLHIRGFGGSPMGGLSTISFGAQTFGLAKATSKAAASTFKNGIRSSGAFVADRPLTPDQVDEAQRLLEEKYAGAMRAGRPLVLNNGMKFEALTINPNDAQMLESRAFSVEEVCRMFGVPPHMIGHTEKVSSWGSGVETMTLGFLQFTLRRRLMRIEQALEKQLLTAEDRVAGVTIKFNIEGLLRGDSKTRAEFYKSALGDTQRPGWMVRNEVRRLENLAPVDGWDDPIALISKAPTEDNGGSAPAALPAP